MDNSSNTIPATKLVKGLPTYAELVRAQTRIVDGVDKTSKTPTEGEAKKMGFRGPSDMMALLDAIMASSKSGIDLVKMIKKYSSALFIMKALSAAVSALHSFGGMKSFLDSQSKFFGEDLGSASDVFDNIKTQVNSFHPQHANRNQTINMDQNEYVMLRDETFSSGQAASSSISNLQTLAKDETGVTKNLGALSGAFQAEAEDAS